MRSEKIMESFLQKERFKKILPFIKGESLLDFGGNRGELKSKISQKYTLCNRDYSILNKKKFDTITILAVIEHIDFEKVFEIINMLKKHLNSEGVIIITTPSKRSKFILELMARLNLIDQDNLKEHKHYWNKSELGILAKKNGLNIEFYQQFELGMNQLVIFNSQKRDSSMSRTTSHRLVACCSQPKFCGS